MANASRKDLMDSSGSPFGVDKDGASSVSTGGALRVALYVRCSTAEQTVDLQLDGLREYAQVRRFEVVHEYVDEGISGAKAKRPALDRLLEDSHRRRFDAVLVWKLDRLGRSLGHLIRVVETLGSLPNSGFGALRSGGCPSRGTHP